MSNVIRFLESMGSEAQWGNITEENLKSALAEANVEDSVRSAILDKDVAQLRTLLQQKPLVGLVIPGEEEEEEEEEEPDQEDVHHASLAAQS